MAKFTVVKPPVRYDAKWEQAFQERILATVNPLSTLVLSITPLPLAIGVIDGGLPDSFYGGARLDFGGVS
jgi:hypothetical protein